MWIRYENKRLVAHISHKQAKIAANKLYDEIGFRGTAKWARKDKTLIEFKVNSLIDSYSPNSLVSSFAELREVIGKYWDDVDDVSATLLND